MADRSVPEFQVMCAFLNTCGFNSTDYAHVQADVQALLLDLLLFQPNWLARRALSLSIESRRKHRLSHRVAQAGRCAQAAPQAWVPWLPVAGWFSWWDLVPQWCLEQLQAHESDERMYVGACSLLRKPRPSTLTLLHRVLYPRDQARARTQNATWNTIQQALVKHGVLPSLLLGYWARQPMSWSWYSQQVCGAPTQLVVAF